MSAPLTHRPGSAVIEQRVKPECVDAYRDWSHKINSACSRHPGFVDLEVFEPVPGVSDGFVIVVRFTTAAESEAWHNSPECQALLEEAAPLLKQKVVFHAPSSVYGSWFSGTGVDVGPGREPSQRWKEALVVLFVLYPTVMLLSLFVTGPLLKGWSMSTGMYVGNMMSVALMTWLLMPVVTGKLSFWLNPIKGDKSKEALGLAIVLGGQLLMVAGFHHFVTH